MLKQLEIKTLILQIVKKYSSILIPFSIILLSLIFNPPLKISLFQKGLWSVEIEQSKHLLDNEFLKDVYYGYSRALRLLPPLVFRILSIESSLFAYLIQLAFNFLMIFYAFKITKEILKVSLKNSILFLVSCSTLYFLNSAFGDTFGHADSFGFTFMLLSLYSTKWQKVALFLLLGYFCSERVLYVGLVSIMVYWYYSDHISKEDKRKLLIFSTSSSLIVYLVIRYILISQLKFSISLPHDVGFALMFKHQTFFQIFFYSFTGLWILFIGLFEFTYKKIIIFLIPILFGLSSFLVADQVRGIAHIFPLFFLLLSEIQKTYDPKQLNLILVNILLVSMLSPSYTYLGEFIYNPSLIYFCVDKYFLHYLDALFKIFRDFL